MTETLIADRDLNELHRRVRAAVKRAVEARELVQHSGEKLETLRTELAAAEKRAEEAERLAIIHDEACAEAERDRDEARDAIEHHRDLIAFGHEQLEKAEARAGEWIDRGDGLWALRIPLSNTTTEREARLKLRAERDRLAEACTKANDCLVEAIPAANKLANDPKGLDWGEVSNYGCDAVWGMERAKAFLDAALTDTPAPKRGE